MTLGLQAYRFDPEDWRQRYAERQRREEERIARLTPVWERDAEILKRCPMKGEHADEPGRCGLCGTELPRMRNGNIHPTRRWCSQECSDRYWQSHGWTFASRAAIRRDGYRCVRCGHPGYGVVSAPIGTFTVEEARVMRQLEVNHRIPRNGRGYHNGCHHHQENLETLCKPCHSMETQKQHRGRRLARGLRILIGIRRGELEVRHRWTREKRIEALPEPLWPTEVAS